MIMPFLTSVQSRKTKRSQRWKDAEKYSHFYLLFVKLHSLHIELDLLAHFFKCPRPVLLLPVFVLNGLAKTLEKDISQITSVKSPKKCWVTKPNLQTEVNVFKWRLHGSPKCPQKHLFIIHVSCSWFQNCHNSRWVQAEAGYKNPLC